MAWQVITPSNNRGRGKRGGGYAVRLALHSRGNGSPGRKFVLTFGVAFMKQMRWHIGDHMQIRYDSENCLLGINRMPAGDFVLHPSGGAKGSEPMIGKISIPDDRFPVDAFIGDSAVVFQKDEVFIQDDIAVICCKK